MTVLSHLQSRYLDTDLHRVWVDETEGVATFPLWNLSGQMAGFQQYRPLADKQKSNHPRDSRYFTYRKNRVVGVWGLESWNLSDTLFVTEGVFDAARITCRGRSAIATLSNDLDDSHKRWLWIVRKYRRVVTVCDNDAAGRKLAKYGHLFHVVESGDLGDASEDYVESLLKEYG
jgi:hypothetical protein